MKKIALLIIVCLLIVFLFGCSENVYLFKQFKFDYAELIEGMQSVEIIDYQGDYQKLKDENQVIILKQLNEVESLDILKDLSNIEFNDFAITTPPSPSGKSIRICYANNSVEVFSSTGTTKAMGRCSDALFMDMINKYL